MSNISMVQIQLEVGKSYRNKYGEIHTIEGEIGEEVTLQFERGYRFRDQRGNTYTPTGMYDVARSSNFDLIEEVTAPHEE